MKEKLEIRTSEIVLSSLAVFAVCVVLYFLHFFVFYNHSKLVCIGEIQLNDGADSIRFHRGYNRFGMKDAERELIDARQRYEQYTQDATEVDEIIDLLDDYAEYPTVIISRTKSGTFWTSKDSGHYGHINYASLCFEMPVKCDDVIYVYVTKCAQIDTDPCLEP